MPNVVLHCYDCGPGSHGTNECPMRARLRHPEQEPIVGYDSWTGEATHVNGKPIKTIRVATADGSKDVEMICQVCGEEPTAFTFKEGKVLCTTCYRSNQPIDIASGNGLDMLAECHLGMRRNYLGFDPVTGGDVLETDADFRERIMREFKR